MNVMIVLVTFPTIDVAREIGELLVERQLVACVNLVPGVESIYRWEGKVCREGEVLGVFKVTEEGYGRFEEALVELHPYDVPEVLGVDVVKGFEGYLGWVRGEVGF